MKKIIKKILFVPYKMLWYLSPRFAESLRVRVKHIINSNNNTLANLEKHVVNLETELKKQESRIVELEEIIHKEYGLKYLALLTSRSDLHP